MKYLTIGVLLAGLATQVSAGPFIELGVGRHGLDQPEWEGRYELGGHFEAGYIWHFRNDVELSFSWQHESQVWEGQPWNDNSESTLDSVLIKVRKEWR